METRPICCKTETDRQTDGGREQRMLKGNQQQQLEKESSCKMGEREREQRCPEIQDVVMRRRERYTAEGSRETHTERDGSCFHPQQRRSPRPREQWCSPLRAQICYCAVLQNTERQTVCGSLALFQRHSGNDRGGGRVRASSYSRTEKQKGGRAAVLRISSRLPLSGACVLHPLPSCEEEEEEEEEEFPLPSRSAERSGKRESFIPPWFGSVLLSGASGLPMSVNSEKSSSPER